MKGFSGFINIYAAAAAAVCVMGLGAVFMGSQASPAAVECAEYGERRTVIPCGTPFGIKMLTDGVIVTDFGCVDAGTSQLSPAEAAGVKKGDVITAINGNAVCDSAELSRAVQDSPSQCRIDLIRGEEAITVYAKPAVSEKDGQYKLGLWTKDSCAGIGTMTFYDTKTGIFGGLGHGVSDSASGVRLPLLSGETTAVTITDVIKGGSGSPGELCGAFISDRETGTILLNSEYGVFGKAETAPILGEEMEIAHKNEVQTGKAVIYTTTGGMTPEEYEIEIVSIDKNSTSAVRNMTIRVTDKELLAKTGGIVQGMSGSPIIQNGRLVGAVTHVLVKDSSMGYAVFAENMCSILDSGLE